MASLLNAQEPPHDLAFPAVTATQNADIQSRSPAMGQPPVSDGGNFERDFLVRPEMHDQNYPYWRPTSSRSRLDKIYAPTPVPPPSNSHHWLLPATTAPKIESNPETILASHDPTAYVAIDPFVPSVAKSIANSSHLPTVQPQVQPKIDQMISPGAHGVTTLPTSSYIIAFLLDTLPRQIYLYFLLTLPSLYFSRVARIFEDAELSMPEIKRMVISSANDGQDYFPTKMLGTWQTPMYPVTSPVVARFKASWEQFVDSLMKEWKTLNLVSVLLLSAILTTLQIDGAVTDPYTRYFAFLALVCSLMSLLYGCIYIIRFNTMRRTHRAAEWAEEAQKTKTFIWWNVWVLLAMPAIWLSWSIIFYLTCVMTFLWRTGTTNDTVPQIAPLTALGPRLSVTFTFLLGLVYLCLIIREFRRYGCAMDKAWRQKVMEWKRAQRKILEEITLDPSSQGVKSFIPFSQMPPKVDPERSDYPAQSFPPTGPGWLPPKPHELLSGAIKVIALRTKVDVTYPMPPFEVQSIGHNNWKRFILDVSRTWDESCQSDLEPSSASGARTVHPAPQDVVAQLVALWNVETFLPIGTQAVLCEEQTDEEPTSLLHTIYIIVLEPSPYRPSDAVEGEQLARRFGKMPAGVRRINLYDPVTPYGDIQKPKSRPLHVHVATSRQPDSTSWTLSHSGVWAARGPGEDEKNPNDGDGHGERVPSLYAQPVFQPQRSDNPAQSFSPPAPVLLPQKHYEVPFDAAKIIDLRARYYIRYPLSWMLEVRLNIERNNWEEFILDVSRTWDESSQRDLEPSSGTRTVHAASQDVVAQLIASWNVKLFLPRGTQAVLCEEQKDEGPMSLSYAIYVIDLEPSPYKPPSGAMQGEQLARQFGKVPAGVRRISLYDPVPPSGEIQKAMSRPLSVHLTTSRQPDSTSWSLSYSGVWAARGPDDDEKNSNDGDGHGESVPSLYAQPDMGSTRKESNKDTTVSIQAAEEDNELSTPSEQETFQEGQQLNQNNLDTEEYTRNDLEAWPNDWRSDYGITIPGEQGPTTSVDELKDPIERTICTALSYVTSDPCVVYDPRFFPYPQTLSFPIHRHNYNDTYFTQLATDPPVEQMRLWHPLLPWYIDVYQSQPNGVTVQDVFEQMFLDLQLQIRGIHYKNTELETGGRIARAFERRTLGNEEEWAKGIKRVDYLEDKVFFVGLVSTGKGLWEMKTIA